MHRTMNTRFVLFCVVCGCAVMSSKLSAFEFRVNNGLKANEFIKVAKSVMSGEIATYLSAAKPEGFYTCTQKMRFVRCVKIFFLQRLDNSQGYSHTGNLASDLINQIVLNNNTHSRLTDKKYFLMTDFELTKKLKDSLAKLLKSRTIQFQYADVLIKFVPSKADKINVLFKKGKQKERSHKTYKKMVEVAVPVMLMPAILLGTFLPYIIPTIKAAAIVSTLINNGALLAALFYAAKNAAPNYEEVHYSYPGYH